MHLHLHANADPDAHTSPLLPLYPALPMQSLLVQSRTMQILSPGPRSHKMAMQGWGWGHTAPQSAGSSTPLRLAQPLAPVLALTWKTWVFKTPSSGWLGDQLTLGCYPCQSTVSQPTQGNVVSHALGVPHPQL